MLGWFKRLGLEEAAQTVTEHNEQDSKLLRQMVEKVKVILLPSISHLSLIHKSLSNSIHYSSLLHNFITLNTYYTSQTQHSHIYFITLHISSHTNIKRVQKHSTLRRLAYCYIITNYFISSISSFLHHFLYPSCIHMYPTTISIPSCISLFLYFLCLSLPFTYLLS